MRTLVISDLHLGAPRGRDLLRSRPAALSALCNALEGVDRFVLLGDVVELRHGRVADAQSAAAPVLGALDAALDPRAEVAIVAGNHDHHLLDAWLARRADASQPVEGLATEVDWHAGEPLARLIGVFGGRPVRASYPGVWLREDVFAYHGHFGDRHTTVPMLERLAAGTAARAVRESADGPRSVEDYERSLAPVYAFIHAVAQAGGGGGGGVSAGAWSALAGGSGAPSELRGLARARARVRRGTLRMGFTGGIALLNRAGIGPLRADLSGAALRRAGLAAQAEVARRLGVRADHLIFGHTHRAGPLPSDDMSEWTLRDGGRLWNTGCWVDEGALLGAEPGRSPYRPGFAVAIEDEGPPALVNLLD